VRKLIPLGELSGARRASLRKTAPVVAVCRAGGRSAAGNPSSLQTGWIRPRREICPGGMLRWRARGLARWKAATPKAARRARSPRRSASAPRKCVQLLHANASMLHTPVFETGGSGYARPRFSARLIWPAATRRAKSGPPRLRNRQRFPTDRRPAPISVVSAALIRNRLQFAPAHGHARRFAPRAPDRESGQPLSCRSFPPTRNIGVRPREMLAAIDGDHLTGYRTRLQADIGSRPGDVLRQRARGPNMVDALPGA